MKVTPGDILVSEHHSYLILSEKGHHLGIGGGDQKKKGGPVSENVWDGYKKIGNLADNEIDWLKYLE